MDFSKAKDLMKLQEQMKKIQKDLENTHIEAEVDGVVVTFDGKLTCVKVEIEDKTILADQSRLEAAIAAANNKWLKKAQEIAAQWMQGVAGDMGLNLPDMGGLM